MVLWGLNEALYDRAKHLFGIWMRDPVGQPQRAQAGIQQAIRAYVISRDLVEKWNPPVC